MPARKISWSVMRVALAARCRGETFEAAAAEAGIGVASLYRFVAENGPMSIRSRKAREGELTPSEREDIFAGLCKGMNYAEIGREIGRPRCTVAREVARNGGPDQYRPHLAEDRAARCARRPQQFWIEQKPALWELVIDRLRAWWSPEQISASLRIEFADDPHWWVSHESIYQAIYVQAKGELRAELAACLRTGRDRRKARSRASSARGARISDMVSISQRPPEAEDRAVPGHWEGDLIVGENSQSAIATIVERSTRFGFMVKLDSKHAGHVAARIAEQAALLGDFAFESLTWDQGTEMADHATFTMTTGVDVYFADPHSPWQRGTNENWNGLARQYFPKGTDLSIHTQADLDAAAHSLNTRPRKTLNWDTPALRFNNLVATTT